MKPITITLDGREVSGHSGMTILDLAWESGIDIPTLCYDPHLTSIGACRMCLVENEQTGALVASCVTPIAPGMVIHTHSPRVIEHRKNIVKLLLASHPDSCLVCDKGNRCQLRQLASDMGIGLVEFQRIPQMAAIEEINPYIERDLSKCILCAKCIRACQELVVEGAIDYFQRGFSNKPATLNNLPLEDSECTFCGTCVALCPTGALTEKEQSYRGTTKTTVQTTCPFCGCGCSISLEVKDNQIVRVSPGKVDKTRPREDVVNPVRNSSGPSPRQSGSGHAGGALSPAAEQRSSISNEVNHGTLCVRGSYGYDFIHSPDRLNKPLIKVNPVRNDGATASLCEAGRASNTTLSERYLNSESGSSPLLQVGLSNGVKDSFTEVSWNEVLEMVASEFKRIKDEHGPNSLAILGSSKCTNEENYLLQRFARCVLGTNHIDNGSRLYSSSTRLGLGSSIGFSGTTNYLSNLEQSEVIMVVGADPSASAPIVEYVIKRAVKYKGAKLILIDPRETKLSSFAHIWLQPKIGTDVALLNSLAKVIIDEGLLDEEFVTRRTDNFKAFTKVLERYSPEYAETITGIPNHEIRAAARLYAMAGGAAIVYGTGITQHAIGTDGVKSISNLALLTGNIGRRGGGIYALQRENNGQGACDMGALPKFLPGYQDVADVQTRRKFEEHWKVSLPANPGLTAMEIIEQVREGKIKGLYIMGENPILSFPHASLVAKALASLDFLVVQEIFLTETARLANVILPASSFAEKEGTFTNFEGRVNRLRKAIEPPGESLPDWEIILRLADRMGSPLPFSSLQEIMDEIEKLVPLYERYTDSERLYQVESETWETRRPYMKQLLMGFARFSPVEYIPQTEEGKKDYPFTLLTGTILYHFGTGARSSRSSRSKKFLPQAFMEVSESDAKKLGINHSDKVKLVSPVAELTTAVRITDKLPEGIVFMPISFPESPVNRLFNILLDPEAKTPSLKACNVRIERVEIRG
ncbi:MAG: molybdopterin-dependent oxidoreductase [Thermodesulfobacteriota bacterium]